MSQSLSPILKGITPKGKEEVHIPTRDSTTIGLVGFSVTKPISKSG